MCSLSWCRHPGGYEVFFNRDERKTRGRALPPAVAVRDGVRYLAPRDADAGGTWLLANEYGLTLALLNYWTTGALPPCTARSRGQWLLTLAGQRAAGALQAVLGHDPPRDCGPFTLAAFDRTQQGGPLVWRWDGAVLHCMKAEPPLCSSSYDPARVIQARQAGFAALPDLTPETLWGWHSRVGNPTAESVRMLRPDAQTWGISRLTAGPGGIDWLYQEEQPELAGPPLEHRAWLALREVNLC